MSSKTLAQDLGVRYVNEFLVGSCVMIGNDVAMLRMVEDDLLHADVAIKDASDRNTMTRKTYPAGTLKSFSDLKYPALGYRPVSTIDGKKQAIVHLSSIRSAHRGLRLEQIKTTMVPVFYYLGHDYSDVWTMLSRADKMQAIFRPQYTTFSAGLRQLLAGDIAGFAVNENLAVGVSCTRSSDRAFDVYYRQRVVGNVTANGTINIANKVMHRHNLSKDIRP